jgi:DNA-binding transcriptional MerR regulator
MGDRPTVYSTARLAKDFGVHPNTVRLYEKWGYLSPAERRPNGYRIFTENHKKQMTLARLSFPGPHPGGSRTIRALVLAFAEGRLLEARAWAGHFKDTVLRERHAAEEAIGIVERWLDGKPVRSSGTIFSRRDAALHLGISVDALRNWERNGLLKPARGEDGSRQYGEPELARAKIIRTLRAAGYQLLPILRMFDKIADSPAARVRESLEDFRDEIGCATNRWMSLLETSLARADRIIEFLETLH